jgi:predicted DNA-binding protein
MYLTISIRLPEELKTELEGLADQTGRGFSDFFQEGLDQWAALNKGQGTKGKVR